MRLATLLLLLALATAGHGQQFHTMAFVNQDFHSKPWKIMERYGKSETEIVAMGHDKFVAWYCEEGRAGKAGRVDAEKLYGFALNECNVPILLSLSREEQRFMESAIVAFADMAKSSVVAAVASVGEDREWSLLFAESATVVNELTYAVLRPELPVPKAPNVKLDTLFTTVSERVRARYPRNLSDGDRLKFLIEHIDKVFKDRSNRDKALARAMSVRLAKMALTETNESESGGSGI